MLEKNIRFIVKIWAIVSMPTRVDNISNKLSEGGTFSKTLQMVSKLMLFGGWGSDTK